MLPLLLLLLLVRREFQLLLSSGDELSPRTRLGTPAFLAGLCSGAPTHYCGTSFIIPTKRDTTSHSSFLLIFPSTCGGVGLFRFVSLHVCGHLSNLNYSVGRQAAPWQCCIIKNFYTAIVVDGSTAAASFTSPVLASCRGEQSSELSVQSNNDRRSAGTGSRHSSVVHLGCSMATTCNLQLALAITTLSSTSSPSGSSTMHCRDGGIDAKRGNLCTLIFPHPTHTPTLTHSYAHTLAENLWARAFHRGAASRFYEILLFRVV